MKLVIFCLVPFLQLSLPLITTAEYLYHANMAYGDVTSINISNLAVNLSKTRGQLASKLATIDLLMGSGPVVPFRTAQRDTNATDVILDELDKASVLESQYKAHELIVKTNIIVQSFKLKGTTIVGLALYRTGNVGQPIRIVEIQAGDDTDEIIKHADFEAAAYLPPILRSQIMLVLPDPVMVVTVFLNDKLFAETNESPSATTGAVFGILIPDFIEVFNAPVKVVYKISDRETEHKRCAYWRYGGPAKGSWARENLAIYCSGYEVCEYFHVTHFGLLITGDEDEARAHQSALDVITLVGCILSILGITGILFTAILFPQWRANRGNIILTNYAIATLLEIILLYASGHAKANAVCDLTWCFWIGVILHYVVLAQFFWVLVISYLQYKRYVEIFGDVATNLVAKSCLIGWIAPLVVVFPVSIAFSDDYTNEYSSVCYPTGMALFIGILIPILTIVLFNLVIFILIARNLFASKKVRSSTRSSQQTLLKFRLLALLFFQLGISWIFGFLGKLHIALVYIFCLTATLQGLFVFLLFIALNKPTRAMYMKLVGLSEQRTTVTYSLRSTTHSTEETGEVPINR